MRKSAVLVIIFSWMTSCTGQQGLLDSQNDLALEHFASFVTSPLDLPTEYAVLVRGERTTSAREKGLSKSDMIYLFAERRSKQDPSRYSASSTMVLGDERPRERSWEQRLQRDGKLYRRSLSTLGRFANKQDQDADASEEDAVIKRVAPHAYPLFLPFALDYEVGAGRVTEDFGNLILDKFELQSCEIAETRELKTAWKYGTRDVFMTLDPKQGGRPSEIIYMGADIKQIKDNTKKINAVHRIKWEKMRWKNGTFSWIPTQCRKTVNDVVNRREYEVVLDLRWKECSEIPAIPEVKQDDWREPIRMIFGDDWSLGYGDWLELQPK